MKRKTKKTNPKSKTNRVVRAVIFLVLAVIVAAALYVLKTPERFTAPTKKKASPAPLISKEKRVSLRLYFGDPESDYLLSESRNVVFKKNTVQHKVQVVVEELLKGPANNLLPTMPTGVALRSIEIKNSSLVVLDFSPELVRNHPGGSLAEMQTIYSLVNSVLGNIPSLTAVQILIDGKTQETLKGHIDIGAPITTNRALVKKG